MADHDPTFFSIEDTTATCGYDFENESEPFPTTRGYIERVEFQNATDGTLRGLSVFGRFGERSVTASQVKACMDENNPKKPHRGLSFSPNTKPYRVDFTFDGKQMARVRESPGAPK